MHRFRHAVALLFVATAPALGQAAHTLTARADNDALNLWLRERYRPDEDYSSGVFVMYDGAWSPWWRKYAHLWLRTPNCADSSSTSRCFSSKAWAGQDMFTPERFPNSEQIDTVGARPNAGWLYYAEQVRRATRGGGEFVTLSLGVTGPPSFAAQTQRIAHALVGYNVPIDWRKQIPFEPGVIASYERDFRWTPITISHFSFQIIPTLGVTAGNISDEATGGFGVRTGWDAGSPWDPPFVSTAPRFAAFASSTQHAVARDIFLDGSTFGAGPHIGHQPFYKERSAGFTISVAAISVGYTANHDDRMYKTGHDHSWSTAVLAYSFLR